MNAESRIQKAEFRTLESSLKELAHSRGYRGRNAFLLGNRPGKVDDPLADYESRLTIPLSTSIKFVALKNIIRFEAARSYTIIFGKNFKSILVAKTLKYFVDQIHPDLFFKSNRSNFVNLQEVCEVEHGDVMQVILTHDQVATIAKKNIPLLVNRMRNFKFPSP